MTAPSGTIAFAEGKYTKTVYVTLNVSLINADQVCFSNQSSPPPGCVA